jgi:hypothetical protein
MDTVLFLETIVHFNSHARYRILHTGRCWKPGGESCALLQFSNDSSRERDAKSMPSTLAWSKQGMSFGPTTQAKSRRTHASIHIFSSLPELPEPRPHFSPTVRHPILEMMFFERPHQERIGPSLALASRGMVHGIGQISSDDLFLYPLCKYPYCAYPPM